MARRTAKLATPRTVGWTLTFSACVQASGRRTTTELTNA
jgi:hypothetical protein